jgi:2-polyprenyl-3-methyl-5-hydroxy-6-metoxy-1,4-benzoquinol methylase
MCRCKICNGKTRAIRDKKKELSYYRCLSCGFVYLDDSHIIDNQREKAHYEKHNNSFESLGYVKMFEDFIEVAVAPYEESIESALEFGCGTGAVLAELLSRRGMEVDRYDIYFHPQKIYEGKQYDLITSTEVFEHLQKPMEVLKLLAKHTKECGYIILMTKFPPADDREFIEWWYRRDITHISFFTPKSFEVMANKIGLKILKIVDKNIVIFQKEHNPYKY